MKSAPTGCILLSIRPLAPYCIARHFAAKPDKRRKPRICWQWAATSASRVSYWASLTHRRPRSTCICCELVARHLGWTHSQSGATEQPLMQGATSLLQSANSPGAHAGRCRKLPTISRIQWHA
jgi:hypothetical protein